MGHNQTVQTQFGRHRTWHLIRVATVCLLIFCQDFEYILKTKRNFTLSTAEYIFSVLTLTNLNIAMSCWYRAYLIHEKQGKLIFFRVICAFIKSTKSAFPSKVQSKHRIWICYSKDHWLAIKNTAQHFVFDV